jgi:hypothetical protein
MYPRLPAEDCLPIVAVAVCRSVTTGLPINYATIGNWDTRSVDRSPVPTLPGVAGYTAALIIIAGMFGRDLLLLYYYYK